MGKYNSLYLSIFALAVWISDEMTKVSSSRRSTQFQYLKLTNMLSKASSLWADIMLCLEAAHHGGYFFVEK